MNSLRHHRLRNRILHALQPACPNGRTAGRATCNLQQPPFRFTLLFLGVIGIVVSLLVAYRGGEPGQLPWNVAGGRGTMSDPYRIATCGQLQNLSFAPAASYVLVNDIDCSGGTDSHRGVPRTRDEAGFVPITGKMQGFTGTLDGAGHAIKNLMIRLPKDDSVGLFSLLGSGARISHLSLDMNIVGRNGVGGIAGWAGSGSTVQDIRVTGNVAGQLSVGGIAGITRGILNGVTTSADVTGQRGIGAVTGILDEGGLIFEAVMSGSVTGITDVGGIAGVSRGAMIDGCVVHGTVQGGTEAGGVVGWLMGGAGRAAGISNCRVLGRLNGKVQTEALVGKKGVK